MKADQRTKKVAFIDAALKTAFERLEAGTFEEKRLAAALWKAIVDLKENPFCGVHVPSRLWPKEYIQKYRIANLWKYDLPGGWRLPYTILGNEAEIASTLIEWLSHKQYERKFGYERS